MNGESISKYDIIHVIYLQTNYKIQTMGQSAPDMDQSIVTGFLLSSMTNNN